MKAINYFDSNNLQFTATANNDYSVTNDATVLEAYRFAIASPYFLTSPIPDNKPQPIFAIPMPLKNGEVLKGLVHLSCTARTPNDILSVRYLLDGKLLYTANSPARWALDWDAASTSPGNHRLSLEVVNAQGRVAATQSVTVRVGRER